MTDRSIDGLLALTGLPTAAGREGRVVAWVRAWAAARPHLALRADRFGNLTLRRRTRPPQKSERPSAPPLYFTAHLDHPAFVVTERLDDRRLRAEFRGGVREAYFLRSRVLVHPSQGPPVGGRVVEVEARAEADSYGANDGDKRMLLETDAPSSAAAGDVATWDVGPPRVKGDRLWAPACDDLAGVAAALAALDALTADEPGPPEVAADVRVLLTRAEEVGFVGAIAAAKGGTLPRRARLLALENSKSFAESPLGGGPIVRVGDFTSTFDPDLTYRVGRIAQALAAADPAFRWQRKLMPGGTCEASAYQAYGHRATCLCLPLGNYHNMDEANERIDAETISLADYRGLVRLLVAVARSLDDPDKAPGLLKRLEGLYERRRGLLEDGGTTTR